MWRDRLFLAMLVFIKMNEQTRLKVMPADTDIFRMEHFSQLVAHQVNDGLEVQLGRQALLDAVDDRQFGIALLGLLEQALGLIEQTGILERHAHAVGQCLQQAYIRIR